jgi:hypothetical protein
LDGGSATRGMRAVSFLGPEEIDAGGGAGGGTGIETDDSFGEATGRVGGGGKTSGKLGALVAGFGTGDGTVGPWTGSLSNGGRRGNWIRTVSRNFVFVPGGLGAT